MINRLCTGFERLRYCGKEWVNEQGDKNAIGKCDERLEKRRIATCCSEKHCPQMYELVKPRRVQSYTHTGVRMRHARFFSAIKRFAMYTSLYTRFYFYRFFLRICGSVLARAEPDERIRSRRSAEMKTIEGKVEVPSAHCAISKIVPRERQYYISRTTLNNKYIHVINKYTSYISFNSLCSCMFSIQYHNTAI